MIILDMEATLLFILFGLISIIEIKSYSKLESLNNSISHIRSDIKLIYYRMSKLEEEGK